MRRFGKILGCYLTTYYALMLEYRAEIFLWVLTGLMPFIMMGIWTKAAAQGHFPMTATEFIRYFTGVFVVRQFTIVWVIWEFELAVVEGRLSNMLLKPINPIWGFITMHLSEQATRLPFWLAIVVGIFCCYPEALWVPHLTDIVLGLMAIVLAFTLRFCMQYTFAMCAFWIERASALEQLSYLPYLFLSGYLAPLNLFPPAVRQLAEWTPFPYVLYFPAQLLIGNSQQLGNPAIAKGFLVMLGWIFLFGILSRVLWQRGLRRYSAMGA